MNVKQVEHYGSAILDMILSKSINFILGKTSAST